MAQDTFTRLLEFADDAQGRGEYDVAYHLLMAALHIADRQRDANAVEEVGRAALRHENALEAIRPPHALSRLRAGERGQTSVFDSLRLHVDAVRVRLKGVEMAPR